MLDAVVEGLQAKKGKDIKVLDMRGIPGASVDYYVIAHGQTDRQSDAIANSVEETVFKKLGLWPYHTEGYENKEWILLDYFNIVAHIFVEKARHFYAFEELWGDAKVTSYETIE